MNSNGENNEIQKVDNVTAEMSSDNSDDNLEAGQATSTDGEILLSDNPEVIAEAESEALTSEGRRETKEERDSAEYKLFQEQLFSDKNLYCHYNSYYILVRSNVRKLSNYYNAIKNRLMSYVDKDDKTHKPQYTLQQHCEVFTYDNVIAKTEVSGGVLNFYLRLNPKKYKTQDAIHKDVSNKKGYEETPLFLKMNNQNRLDKALRLIDEMMTGLGCVVDEDFIELDYASFFTREILAVTRPVETTDEQVEPQKELFTEDYTPTENDILDILSVSELDELLAEIARRREEKILAESRDFDDEFFAQENIEEIDESEGSEEESSTETVVHSSVISEQTSEAEDNIQTETEYEPETETEVEDEPKTDPELETVVEDTNETDSEPEPEPEPEPEAAYYVPDDDVTKRPVFREVEGVSPQKVGEGDQTKSTIFDAPLESPQDDDDSKKKKRPNVWRELASYGYNFVLLKQIEIYLIAILAVVALGLVYKLTLPFILILVAATLFCMPSILIAFYRNKYEEKKFSDVQSYVEQMLYSFRRNSKILMSLRDSLVVFPNGYMHDKILEAISIIQNSEANGNVYEKALAVIEKAYPCRRIMSLHRYLIKVEDIGGNHDSAINALLTDRRLWIDRVSAFKKQCSSLIRENIVSTVFTLAMACVIIYMMPSDLCDISESIIYQIVTTIFVIVNVLVVRATFKKTVVLLDDTSEENVNRTISKLNWLRHYDAHKELNKSLKTSIILGVAMMLGIIMKNTFLIVVALVAIVYVILFQRVVTLNSTRKSVCREIDKVYPDWLLELALLLQTDNMHNAIEKTLDTAPEIIRADLVTLANDIKNAPVDLAPYATFLEFLPLPTVHSSMKLLYSISEFGASDESVQLSELVERNNVLMDRAEKYKNDDKLSGIFVIKFVPVLASSVKMIVDLGIFLLSYMGIIMGGF